MFQDRDTGIYPRPSTPCYSLFLTMQVEVGESQAHNSLLTVPHQIDELNLFRRQAPHGILHLGASSFGSYTPPVQMTTPILNALTYGSEMRTNSRWVRAMY